MNSVKRSLRAPLRRAKLFVTKDTLVRMYKSLLLPHFSYCSTVWHDGYNSHITKIQKHQKRTARETTNSSYENDHSRCDRQS